jgi:hypothetical protein
VPDPRRTSPGGVPFTGRATGGSLCLGVLSMFAGQFLSWLGGEDHRPLRVIGLTLAALATLAPAAIGASAPSPDPAPPTPSTAPTPDRAPSNPTRRATRRSSPATRVAPKPRSAPTAPSTVTAPRTVRPRASVEPVSPATQATPPRPGAQVASPRVTDGPVSVTSPARVPALPAGSDESDDQPLLVGTLAVICLLAGLGITLIAVSRPNIRSHPS